MEFMLKRCTWAIAVLLCLLFGSLFVGAEKGYAETVGVPTDIEISVGDRHFVTYYFTGTDCQSIEFRSVSDSGYIEYMVEKSDIFPNAAYYHVAYFGLDEGKTLMYAYDVNTGKNWGIYTVKAVAPSVDVDSCLGRQFNFSFTSFSDEGALSDGYVGAPDAVYHGNGLSYTVSNTGGWPRGDGTIIWRYRYDCTLTLFTEGEYRALIYRGDPIVRPLCRLNLNIHPHEATVSSVQNVVPATCGAPGSQDVVRYCDYCNVEVSRQSVPIEPTGLHTWSPAMVTDLNPTCTAIGYESFHCLDCSATTGQHQIPALGHSLLYYAAKDPTCTQSGYEDYRACMRCDYTTYQRIAPTGHTLVTEPGKAATCTESGFTEETYCSVCGTVIRAQKTIDPLGHSSVKHEAKAASCEAIGWDAYEVCSRCGYTSYKEKPALGHDVTKHEAKAASCEAIGWDAYEDCSRCDYSTYEEKPALGHDYGPYVSNKDATCTKDGTKSSKCSRCESELTIVDEGSKLDHSMVPHAAQAATCTQAGWHAYETCKTCDLTTYREIKPRGHDFVDYKYDENATCTKDGTETAKCLNCDATQSRSAVGTKLAHSFSSYVSNGDATCTLDGTKTATCVYGCGEVKNIADPGSAIGHTWVVDYTIDASEWADGKTGYKCSVCRSTKEEVIPKKRFIADEPKLNTLSYVYDGNDHDVYSTGSGYFITGTTIARNVGTYTVMFKLFDDYVWKDGTNTPRKLTWSIKKRNLSQVTLETKCTCCAKTWVSGDRQGYSGKTVYPRVYAEGQLIYSNGSKSNLYKVVFDRAPKKVGKYSVTVTAVGGNYTGSVKKTFYVVPRNVKGYGSGVHGNKFEVYGIYKSPGATGYQMRYSLKKNMKKSVTVSSKKSTLKSKKLKKGKKFYYQLRSYAVVNGQKYYSDWSFRDSFKA